MQAKIYKQFISVLCVLIPVICFSQSIGYSISYTLPKSQEDRIQTIGRVDQYNRSSEFSFGISLNNYEKQAQSIQLRLSHYTAKLNSSRPFFSGQLTTESKVKFYMMELETYVLSKELSKTVNVSLGFKYSKVLRTTHESFIEDTMSSISPGEINFGGIRKTRWLTLLRTNFGKLKVWENWVFMPSYVFEYGNKYDFVDHGLIEPSSMQHRFELTLIKQLSTQ